MDDGILDALTRINLMISKEKEITRKLNLSS
jgi:hypothetical protein